MNKMLNQLVRKASAAVESDVIPSDPLASWVGKVQVALPNESWPVYLEVPMKPFGQFNLSEMPYKPESLTDICMITVYADLHGASNFMANGGNFVLRTYQNLNDLISIEEPSDYGRDYRRYPEPDELIPIDGGYTKIRSSRGKESLLSSNLKRYPLKWMLIDDYPSFVEAQCLSVKNDDWEDYLWDEYEEEASELNHETLKFGGWASLVREAFADYIHGPTRHEAYGLPANRYQWLWDMFESNPAYLARPEYVFQLSGGAVLGWGNGADLFFGRGTGQHKNEWYADQQDFTAL